MALSAAANNANAAVNGISGTQDTAVTMPAPDRLYGIGDWSGVSQPWIGHIKEVRYYNVNASQERNRTDHDARLSGELPRCRQRADICRLTRVMCPDLHAASGVPVSVRRFRRATRFVLFSGMGIFIRGNRGGELSLTIEAGLER